MRLDLDTLELDRFKSFNAPARIDFVPHGVGLHFMRGINEASPQLGANGAGKSTIWDALTWCWYGRTVDGLRGPDVVPWQGKGTTVVRTYLGKEFIERTANPNSLRIGSVIVGQEQVEELLGINFDTFCATLLLGQGMPLFYDLPPRGKMDLFSSVLNLGRWEDRSSRAGTEASRLQSDMDKIAGELIALKREEETTLDSIDRIGELSDDWNTERLKRLESMDVDLKKLEAEFDKVTTLKEVAESGYDFTQTEIAHTETATKNLRETIRKLDLAKLRLQAQAESDRSMLAKLEQAEESGKCPTCGQKMPNRKHMLDELAQRHKQLAEHNQKIKAISKDMEKPTKELNSLNDALDKLHDKSDKHRQVYELHRPRFYELEQQLKSIRLAKKDKSLEDNPYRAQLTDLKKRSKAIARECEDLDREKGISERRMERTKYWIKGFKDVRLHIIDEVLQELELTTNAMLDDVGLVDWTVHYDVEKETKSGTVQRGLNVFVQSPNNRNPVRWESWSGGEGQRLRIIGALSLSDVLLNHAGVEAGFDVLDEPTQHMSPEGVRDLCDFLADRAQALGRQTWLVDHHAIESSRFSSILTVRKGERGSQIENPAHLVASGEKPRGNIGGRQTAAGGRPKVRLNVKG